MNAVLLGENFHIDDIYQNPSILSSFKYTLKTSVEVERSFSVFKSMLTDGRHNLMEEKLEYIWLVIYFNNKYNKKIYTIIQRFHKNNYLLFIK